MDAPPVPPPLVAKFCAGCHGATKPKGGVSFAGAVPADAWAAARDSLRAGDMPPAGKPQPSAAEKADMLRWLDDTLKPTAADPGRPVLRRLTRLEYNNAVRDLLGLTTDLFTGPERLPFKPGTFDPSKPLPDVLRVEAVEYGQPLPALLAAAGLPGDNRAAHGFSNRGDAQNVSPLLLEKYLATAAEVAASPKLLKAAPKLTPLLTATDRAGVNAALEPLLLRAFRRPPAPEAAERYLKPFDAAIARGAPPAEAARASLRAVLASPEFLFLVEPVDPAHGATRPLDGYELATRLSFFLWATGPDDELLRLAAGPLTDPAVLAQQARRMLRDPKARELTEAFAVQWLRLNELWAAQPDRDRYPTFYAGPQGKGTLHADLMAEALLQFHAAVVEDRPVTAFIATDAVHLNRRLIEHYGLADRLQLQLRAAGMIVSDELKTAKGPAANRARTAADQTWLKVPVGDPARGGLLTCGAVLTATSLPGRTSPVKRGAWVLEAVFNRPPPEPTVVVPPLDDRRAAEAGKTVRQKLEAHRADPNCSSCHARIDPPGFALEAFDPVGRLRTHDDGLPIDAAASFSDGRSFDGPAAFKRVLLADPAAFVRGFTEHLLSYALGRKLEHFDEPAVTAVVEAAATDGYRLSAVVAGVVTSYPFRFVRNTPEADR